MELKVGEPYWDAIAEAFNIPRDHLPFWTQLRDDDRFGFHTERPETDHWYQNGLIGRYVGFDDPIRFGAHITEPVTFTWVSLWRGERCVAVTPVIFETIEPGDDREVSLHKGGTSVPGWQAVPVPQFRGTP